MTGGGHLASLIVGSQPIVAAAQTPTVAGKPSAVTPLLFSFSVQLRHRGEGVKALHCGLHGVSVFVLHCGWPANWLHGASVTVTPMTACPEWPPSQPWMWEPYPRPG